MKKMDVNIKVSDVIDLEAFRGHGKRPDEELLPSDDKEASSNAVLPHVDAAIVDTVSFSTITFRFVLFCFYVCLLRGECVFCFLEICFCFIKAVLFNCIFSCL